MDEVKEVTAARCLSCLNCVEVCPREKEGALTWGPPRSFGRPWPQAALIGILLLSLAAAVGAAYALPLPSYRAVAEDRGDEPAETATLELKVNDLTCRGRASLLMYFVERDDEFEIPGYLLVEAWPGPGYVPVRITYDPSQTDEDAIREAITEPYFDGEIWRSSPFQIEGYDPLGLEGDSSPDGPEG